MDCLKQKLFLPLLIVSTLSLTVGFRLTTYNKLSSIKLTQNKRGKQAGAELCQYKFGFFLLNLFIDAAK